MLRRALLVAVLCVLACVGSAGAVQLRTPDGQVAQPYQRWANRALVPTAHATVTVHAEPCDGGGSCSLDGDPPELWIDPATPRSDLYHELGHVFDYRVLTGADRRAFLAIIGQQGRAWRSPPNSPHERFAEAYRLCARGWTPSYAEYHGGLYYGYFPTLRRHRRACALIRRAGRRSAI